MMTVRRLLAKLQKMPKNAVVGFADADASPGAVSSWITSVEFRTKEVVPDCLAGEKEEIEALPDKLVVLRG